MTNISDIKLAGSSVLVVGDAMIDQYWMGDVNRISPEAPVPIVRVTRESFRPGGAANVALNVNALGGDATLMCVLGQDEPSRKLLELLEISGVAVLAKHDPNMRTIVKLRVTGRSQQLLRIDFEELPREEVLAQMLDEFGNAVQRFDAIILSDYGKGGLAHVGRMIQLARDAGKAVLVDPKGDDYSCYRGATVITPNRAELICVVGDWATEAELEDKAQCLRRELAIDTLLLTRSEEGISLFDDLGQMRVPTDAREVFDVTGAGDTVIATLGALMAAGATARAATLIANRAAGIVVRKFGTASVSYEELFG